MRKIVKWLLWKEPWLRVDTLETGFPFFFFKAQWRSRTKRKRDRRWRERRRGGGDGANEGFIICSWKRVRSSWPGDLLRSQPLTLLCFCRLRTLPHAGRALTELCCCVMQLFHLKMFTPEATVQPPGWRTHISCCGGGAQWWWRTCPQVGNQVGFGEFLTFALRVLFSRDPAG